MNLASDHRFGHPTYVVKRQFFKLIGANLRIYDPQGNLVLFVHQKGFKLREDIRVYADEAKAHELIAIKARQIMDFKAAYDVVDVATGEKVGALKRKGWASILQDSWIIMDVADREIGQIKEDHMILALIRRFLSALVPQNYDVLIGTERVADLRQRFNPFVYHMDVDFTMDPGRRLDRRLALAAVVLLATVEGKEG